MKSYKENWKKIYQGAKDAGKGDQILIENFGETLSGEYSTEELMEMAIAARVDGIIVQVRDEEAVSTQIDKAEEEDRKIRVTVLLNSEERNAAPKVIFTAISETTASIASKIELTSKVIDNTGMFESEENVRDLILDTSYPDIIVCMSAVDTSSAIEAKRGRNVSCYNEEYSKAKKLYDYLQSCARSLNTSVFLENSQNYSVLRSTLNYVVGFSMFLLTVSMLVALVWIVMMTRTITRPLLKLAEAANTIAKGGLEVDFPIIDTGDEISTVAKACNKIL